MRIFSEICVIQYTMVWSALHTKMSCTHFAETDLVGYTPPLLCFMLLIQGSWGRVVIFFYKFSGSLGL